MPWQRLIDALSPSYFPNAAGKRGRPPIGLERMLRIYFLQQWYALADEALEDAIYDSQAMRDFVGIDLAIESVPDATTLLRFRHLLEKHALTQRKRQRISTFFPATERRTLIPSSPTRGIQHELSRAHTLLATAHRTLARYRAIRRGFLQTAVTALSPVCLLAPQARRYRLSWSGLQKSGAVQLRASGSF